MMESPQSQRVIDNKHTNGSHIRGSLEFNEGAILQKSKSQNYQDIMVDAKIKKKTNKGKIDSHDARSCIDYANEPQINQIAFN